MRQRAHLGAREGSQTKRIVEGIPEIEFVAREVECILRERQNELKRVKTRFSKCCETMRALTRLRLGLFKAPRQCRNDTENR